MRRDFQLGDRIFVDATYTDESVQKQEESKETSAQVVKLRMEPFEQAVHSNTVLFSTFKPDEICEIIAAELQEKKDAKVTMSDKKWKLSYTVLAGEQAEPGQGCAVKVKLYAVAKDRVAVEFRRTAGDSWFFYEHFNSLKGPLRMLNDAVLTQ